MKYVVKEMKLYTDDDRLIKRLECPLKKEWKNLLKIESEDAKRRCCECDKNVLDISMMSDARALIIAEYDPNVCLHVHSDAENVEWIGEDENFRDSNSICSNELLDDCRVVKTARSKLPMNFAAIDGFNVLVKKVEENPEIQSKIAVRQDLQSQRVDFLGDYRDRDDSGSKVVVDFFFYSPCCSSAPVAAYIVPKDIKVGERVFIPDLIENMVGSEWNQGNVSRRERAYATWNGEGFDIEPIPVQRYIG